LDLIPSFCISEVFPRPTALYLVLKHNAECSLFEPPFDVSGKRLKTPILFDSKVIHCYSLSSRGFGGLGDEWRRRARKEGSKQRAAACRFYRGQSVLKNDVFATPKRIIQLPD
jgi:hypothetical protein